MSNLDEGRLERILNIVGPFIMGEVEEITPFDALSNEKREEVLKLTLKASEVTLMIVEKLLKQDSLDDTKLDTLEGFMKGNEIEKALAFINEE